MSVSREWGRGFQVRTATPDDLRQCRELMISVFDNDFGYGYLPEFHGDVDDLQGTYLDNPRHTLFVAVDDDTRHVIACAGVKQGGPRPRVHPQWLVDQYDRTKTAEIVRVYVNRAHRKRGIGHALVKAGQQFVADEGGYSRMYLHTEASYPGALVFWTSLAKVVYDGRDEGWKAIHFELPIPVPSRSS
jgi:GNAT superfamily N-acetyltransferase